GLVEGPGQERRLDREDAEEFLEQRRVVEEEGLVERGEDEREDRGAVAEKAPRGLEEHPEPERAQRGLAEADPEEVPAEDLVEQPEAVGIQRILIERAIAPEGPVRDLVRPLVVGRAVDDRGVEVGLPAQREDEQHADEE